MKTKNKQKGEEEWERVIEEEMCVTHSEEQKQGRKQWTRSAYKIKREAFYVFFKIRHFINGGVALFQAGV